MPKSANEKALQAKSMYKNGMKLIEIAKALDVPEGTVRSWKNRGAWNKSSVADNCNATPEPLQRKKPGAPYGNKNAVGASGNPHPEKNALKHGAYAAIDLNNLDPDEIELLDNIAEDIQDEEKTLQNEIKLFTLRENRLLKAIKLYSDTPDQMILEETSKITGAIKKNKHVFITRFEQELNAVQRAKTQAAAALAKIRVDKQKLEPGADQNELAKAWVDAVLQRRKEENNE